MKKRLFFGGIVLFVILGALAAGFVWVKQDIKTEQVGADLTEIKTDHIDFLDKQKIVAQAAKLPLAFVPQNKTENSKISFVSRSLGNALLLAPDEAVVKFHRRETISRPNLPESISEFRRTIETFGGETQVSQSVVKMKLVGANPNADGQGINQLEGKVNYLYSDKPENWQTDVPMFSQARFSEVYAGVDVVYYGNQEKLEYDFVVKPNANPDNIKLRFEGADSLQIDSNGDLIVKTGEHELRQHKPIIYQEIGGERKPINGSFAIQQPESENSEVSLVVGDYDRSKNLVIDPVLTFSTYIGGANETTSGIVDDPFDMEVDSQGNVIITGETVTVDYPTLNPAQATFGGGLSDVFVTKLKGDGTGLIFSTFIGGNNNDRAYSLDIDSAGNLFVSGITRSTNFPTVSPLQNNLRGAVDSFVSKLNPTGSSLLYSTYLGGTGEENDTSVEVDPSGNICIVGLTGSTDFPTVNPIQPNHGGVTDFYITRINPAGNTILFSTYFGGSNFDFAGVGNGMDVGPDGSIVFVGNTGSNNFPLLNPIQSEVRGSDAVVVMINNNNQLVFSTRFGGNSGEDGHCIKRDAAGNIYFTGYTNSSTFPVLNAAQPVYGGKDDGYVVKFNPTGSAVLMATYLGGTSQNPNFGNDYAFGLAIDNLQRVYVTGTATSANFPIFQAFRPCNGIRDAFVSVVDTRVGRFDFSTCLGGLSAAGGRSAALDSSGNLFAAGQATANFPTTTGVYQGTLRGSYDNFVVKISNIRSLSQRTPSDFDGDGRTDFAVFRPNNQVWYIRNSGNNSNTFFNFGASTDKIVPADYDGDGRTDIAVLRPDEGAWYLQQSLAGFQVVKFLGDNSDLPAPADFDGDGKDDLAIYRPSTRTWYLLKSREGFLAVRFGLAEDIPVPADYDGDGKADIINWRPSNGIWYIRQSSNNQTRFVQFGLSGDKPVTGDFDGDLKVDLAVYRPTQGIWYILQSQNGFRAQPFGLANDRPAVGDYNGDSRADIAVWRGDTGVFYVLQSNNAFNIAQWGLNGDRPTASAYVP